MLTVRRKRCPIIAWLLLVSWTCADSGAVLAESWRIDPPDLLPEASVQRLRIRHPEIREAQSLSSLLGEITTRHPMVDLRAYWTPGGWVLRGKRAVPLAEVQLNVVGRDMAQQIDNIVAPFIGQADTPETQAMLTRVISEFMEKRGFPKANVFLERGISDSGAVYRVTLDEGPQCVLDSVTIEPQPLAPGYRLPLTVGSPCDRDAAESVLDEYARSLAAEGFAQARVALKTFVYNESTNTVSAVVQATMGRRVLYRIVEADRTFSIHELFSTDGLDDIDPSVVAPEAMAAELERRYQLRGYDDVAVDEPQAKQLTSGELEYTLGVRPGPLYTITSVSVEGVTVFPESEVLAILRLRSQWGTQPVLSQTSLREGMDALRALYVEQGYWSASVREPRVTKDPTTGTAQVVVLVDEGLPRVLDRVVFHGHDALSEDDLRSLLPLQPGDVMNRGAVMDLERAVRRKYIDEGFLYVDVKTQVSSQLAIGKMPTLVEVTLVEGKRVHVGDIQVTGLVRTNPKVILRELLFASGDIYRPEEVASSRQALLRLGLFRTVTISQTDRNAFEEQLESIDLTIHVREGRPGNVSFGPGWTYLEGLRFVVEGSYSNLGGVGRQVFVRGGLSQDKNQESIAPPYGEDAASDPVPRTGRTLLGRTASVGFLEPYVGGVPLDGTISASHRARARSFWLTVNAAEAALTHKLTRYLPGSSLSVFTGQRLNRIESAVEEDIIDSGNVRIGDVGLRGKLDFRNDVSWPSAGGLATGELAWASYALGSSVKYFRWDLAYGHYWALTPSRSWVVAAHAGLTSYENIAREGQDLRGDTLPVSERLHAGGADTVRGYRDQKLGPVVVQDGGSPKTFGGTSRTVAKVELRYRWSEALATSAFLDSGNVFLSAEEAEKVRRYYESTGDTRRSLQGNLPYRYADLLRHPEYLWTKHYLAYGIAGSYLTALGPLSLSVGFPWIEPKTQECRADPGFCYPRGSTAEEWYRRPEVHFSIGSNF